MATIGEATIDILANSKAFDRTLDNLGRSTAGALERGTQGFVARANDLGAQFGERLGASASRWLRRGLLGAAAGVAAAVGVVLVRGFRRFTTIQDATASLTLQLGDARKAASLLGKVLKVVEGTPFALDEFVGAARNLVAASVDLEKVPGILEAIGDAAAAAGGSSDDVNNVVDSFARIATGAKLTLLPIRELEQKGVPALRILANQAGISANEMAKRITKGSVDSKKAIDDLVKGIENGTEGLAGSTVAFAGQAQEVGNTVSGAYSNMLTAVSRFGAKVITVFADGGKGGDAIVLVLNRVRETIDILGDAAVRMAKKFVGSDGFGAVLSFFDELPGRVEKATASLGSKGGFSKAFASMFGRLNFNLIASRFVDALTRAFDRLPHEKISRLFTDFIVRGIAALAESSAEITVAVIAASPAIIKGIIEGLLRAARNNPLNMAALIGALGLPGVGTALAGFFRFLPFGSIVSPLITGLTKAIQAGFRAIGLGAAFRILGDKMALGVVGLVLRIGPAVAGAAGAVALSVAVAAGVVFGVLLHNVIEKFFPQINRALERAGGAIFDFFADHIFPFFAAIPGGMLRGLVAGVSAIVGFFAALPGRIIRAFGHILRTMYEVGSNIIKSMAHGIRDALHGVVDAIIETAKAVVGAVRNFFGIGSPSKVFMGFGRNLVDGLVKGIENQAGQLDGALSRLASRTGPFDITANLRAASTPAGVTNIFQEGAIQTGQTDPQVLANLLSHKLAQAVV